MAKLSCLSDKIAETFFDWYINNCYPHYKDVKHPKLKIEQKNRVLGVISEFIFDAGCGDVDDIDILVNMANVYFRQPFPRCDHNINHFANFGVLKTQYYKSDYRDNPLPREYHDL